MNACTRYVFPKLAAAGRAIARGGALGVVSLMVAGCGTDEELRRDLADSFDRIADAIVEELTGETPGTALIPTIAPIGSAPLVAVDGIDDGYITTFFYDWGYWGQMVREDVATCAALDCVPEGEKTLFRVYLVDTDVASLRDAAEAAAVEAAANQESAETVRDAAVAATDMAQLEFDAARENQENADLDLAVADAEEDHAAFVAAEAAAALAAAAHLALAAAEAARDDARAAAALAAARALVARADADAAAAAAALRLAVEEPGVDAFVEGTPSGTSPVSGSAVWTGGVRGYSSHVVDFSGSDVTTYAGVEGESRLEVDFDSVSVDVDFTNFTNGQADMSWSGLTMDNGVFGYGTTSIDGTFYGRNHEGVAGTFDRDGLTGVFGAIRTP